MFKKHISLLTIVTLLSVFLGSCEKKESVRTETAQGEGGVTTIRFYGSDSAYNQNIVKGFEAANPDIKVEIVPVDFDNAEQVIKTGIASGDPVDVSFFWGTNINAFSNNDMAYDFTADLSANNNAWRNTFVPKYLDGGKVGNGYYAISYQPVIETLFYNADLFKEYNLTVPVTWDDFLKVCETLKSKGIYGMSNWTGQNHQLLVFAYQEMANKGVLEKATAGELPFAGPNETPGLRTALTMLKDCYDKGYWYPGQGALTATKDQVQAAFYQQRTAMLFDAGSNVGTYQTEAPFTVGVMKFPILDADSKYGVNVVTNALFIPANAKNKSEAVRFIKYYTGDAGMTEIVASGRLPSTVSMQDKIDNVLMRDLLLTAEGNNVVSYQHLQNLSPEIASFLTNDLVGLVCSGTSIDNALAQFENLRQTTIRR
jgi:ABC-type glycerol-3-phosphate transport system substrate-binding protein